MASRVRTPGVCGFGGTPASASSVTGRRARSANRYCTAQAVTPPRAMPTAIERTMPVPALRFRSEKSVAAPAQNPAETFAASSG
jgi:hypothetical protein